MKDRQPPMYLTIMEDLRAKIDAGAFDFEEPLCTEKSLGEAYKVSRITAKRALDELENQGLIYRKRGLGSFVRQDRDAGTRYRIPAPVAAQKSAALMIPFSFTRGGIFSAVESAASILAACNIYLTLHVYTPGFQREYEMLDQLYQNQAAAVIYYPSSARLPTEILEQYNRDHRPVIILDKPHAYPQYSSIVSDNVRGSRLLTSHLLDYGHRKICYLSRYSCEEISSIKERYQGYREAMAEYGNLPTRFVKIGIPKDAPFDYPMLKHVVNSLVQEGMTAIVCENDEVAFYVHMCSRSLFAGAPRRLSITGFDNINWSTTGNAQITTAAQDFSRIGEEIAKVILQPKYQPVHKIVPVTLVPRRSTGPVGHGEAPGGDRTG